MYVKCLLYSLQGSKCLLEFQTYQKKILQTLAEHLFCARCGGWGAIVSMLPVGGETIYLIVSLRERPEHAILNPCLSLSLSWSQSACRTAAFELLIQVKVL